MWRMEVTDKGFFTEEERRWVAAVFRRLVPGDASRGVPGADDAGAVDFLDRLLTLTERTYFEIPAWQSLYREALSGLNRASLATYELDLGAVEDVQMQKLLESLRDQAIPETHGLTRATQRRLFDTLHRHCIQGCFADPRWGGNRNRIMWRWLGYLHASQEQA